MSVIVNDGGVQVLIATTNATDATPTTVEWAPPVPRCFYRLRVMLALSETQGTIPERSHINTYDDIGVGQHEP
jgi:hypothetical protein